MPSAKTIKEMMRAVVRKEEAKERRLKPDKIKEILLHWLEEIKMPAGVEANAWEDLIQEFPVDPDDERETGLQMLFAVRLATHENRYLISVMRSLSLDHPDVGSISAHVNWKPTEKKMQRTVEQTYTGEFDDVLRPKHALWAQTYKMHELREALFSCAVAILSHELTVAPDEPLKVESIPWVQPPALTVPEPVDEEA